MRDFRDAKAMAHALHDALRAEAFQATYSQCLELIAKAFGYENWNILSAKIQSAKPPSERERSPAGAPGQAVPETLNCSFCGKSQHDVRKLIAGPSVYICDECVDLCHDIVDDTEHDAELFSLMQSDESARALSTEELAHCVERARKGAERYRFALQAIERKLAALSGEIDEDRLLALSRFRHFSNKTTEELIGLQKLTRHQLKRYEDALRVATASLDESRKH
jgi:hypothetical protein